jgi:hypothetical protein
VQPNPVDSSATYRCELPVLATPAGLLPVPRFVTGDFF